jgi:CheY-like chemotaxis protein
VVDDNRDGADSLAQLLTLWGYRVHTAYDGAHALRTACEARPDCSFVDVNMPIMDGYAFARAVRRDTTLRATRLVALTAYSDKNHLTRVWAAGFDFYLNKPADPLRVQSLLEEIAEEIQRCAAERANNDSTNAFPEIHGRGA